MSDPFEDAMAKAEAEQAAARAAMDARKAKELTETEARHTALREELNALKAVVLAKEAAFAARGFRVSEAIDKQRFNYGLLLSGGRKRIAIWLEKAGGVRLQVYWEGVRNDDGWQTVIKSEDAATSEQMMATLGDWLVRYGQTEIK